MKPLTFQPAIIAAADIYTAEWRDEATVVVLHFGGQSVALTAPAAEWEEAAIRLETGFTKLGTDDDKTLLTVRWAVRTALLGEGINDASLAWMTGLNSYWLLLFEGGEEDTAEALYACRNPVLHVSIDPEFQQVALRVEDAALTPKPLAAEAQQIAIH